MAVLLQLNIVNVLCFVFNPVLVSHAVRTLRLICACAEDYRCLHEVDPTPKTAAM